MPDRSERQRRQSPSQRNRKSGDRRPQQTRQAEAVRPAVQWLTIDEGSDGQRLDNFLMARLRGVPRSTVYRIIRKGEVRVNRGRAKPDTRLQAGDQIRVPPVVCRESRSGVAPGSRVQAVVERAIVYEDEGLLVVNKPAGIAVHGGSGLSFGLIEVLRASRPDARFLELVHRLDRDTSGLVMVAKKRSMLRHLQEELRCKRIRKRYHALLLGRWPASLTRVEQPLLRYEMPNGERRVRVDAAGKASLTNYRCLEVFPGYSLVEASPVTGRTHQIRVHSAWAGHPVAGDDKYMDAASLRAFRARGGNRLMLHARELSFRLPGNGETKVLEAPYDEAFARILAGLRAQYREAQA